MAIQSGGALTSFPGNRVAWSGSTAAIPEWVSFAFGSYAAIYEKQPWVATLVDKISVSHARLPYKVYRREESGRPASDGPYAALMKRPCPTLSNFDLWRWTTAVENIHGDAYWHKVRDAGGRPVAVFPWHPSRIQYDSTDGNWYRIDAIGKERVRVDRRDLVHFRTFNPNSPHRGLSPLEPLRATLANEDGAQRASSSMWTNGARPSVWLEHPKTLGPGVTQRLAQTWADTHGGVDNWSKVAVLEEGMAAKVLPINYKDLAYIDSRKLNRDEVCSRFDVPPPVVHILDRATFSNITEQMRSMYRDSMGWRINHLEDTLELELRDGSLGTDREPDFGDEEYGEFLMDEVLRGAFETRQEALRKADHMTIAEKRELENLPFIEGTDRIFLNSASLPLDSNGELVQPVGSAVSNELCRTVMGRLGRIESADAVDIQQLTNGLPGHVSARVAVAVSSCAGLDVAALRSAVSDALNGGTDD